MAAGSDLIPGRETHDWTLGTGVLNDASNLWHDYQHGGDSLDFTFDGVSAGLDTFVTLVDPVGALCAGVVGFVLENVPGIRELWNMLSGDPEAIQQAAMTWQNISAQLNEAAESFSSAASEIERWSGAAAASFRKAATDFDTIVRGVAANTHDFSLLITGMGCIVAALREVIYWLISTWLTEEVIPEAVAALASSWCTFGGSLAAFLAWLTISTSLTLGVAGEKVANCCVKVAEVYAKIGEGLSKAAEGAAAAERGAQGLSAAAEQAKKAVDNPTVAAVRGAGRHAINRHKADEEHANESGSG